VARSSRVVARRAVMVEARAKTIGMGMMGTKAGMTTFFTPSGEALPCTVIALEDGNVVSQVIEPA
jgi:large subunit ribosomal protein L3